MIRLHGDGVLSFGYLEYLDPAWLVRYRIMIWEHHIYIASGSLAGHDSDLVMRMRSSE